MQVMDIVGERILLARRRRITQKDLAQQVGLSAKHLSQVETGVKHDLHMQAESILLLADALQISTDYLLGRTDSMHG
jgi:transcriptional regulator with XRE-family HTH domain